MTYNVTLFPAPKKITRGERKGEYSYPTKGEQRSVNWTELTNILGEPTKVVDKQATPMISPCWFNGVRNEKNGGDISLIIWDIDNKHQDVIVKPKEVESALKKAGLMGGYYTTYSSTPECPRMRLIIPLTKPIPKESFAGLFLPTLELLGLTPKMPAFGISECLDTIRFSFLGATSEEQTSFTWKSIEGDPLDWTALELKEPDLTGKAGEKKDWSFLKNYTGNLRTLDIEKLELLRGGRVLDDAKEGYHHIKCPWYEDHSGGIARTKDTCIIKHEDEHPQFYCLHDSCKMNGRDIQDYLEIFTVEQVDLCCAQEFEFMETDTSKIFEAYAEVMEEHKDKEVEAKTIDERLEELSEEFDVEEVRKFLVALSLEPSAIIAEGYLEQLSKMYGIRITLIRKEFNSVKKMLAKLQKTKEKDETYKNSMENLSKAVTEMNRTLYYSADGHLYEWEKRWRKRNFRLTENVLLARGIPKELIGDAKVQIPVCEGIMYNPLTSSNVIETRRGHFLNEFYGYPLEAEENDWSIPEKILKHLTNYDQLPDGYDWCMQWLAQLIQDAYIRKSARKNLSAIVFATCAGAGKGMLAKILNLVWGENFGFLDKNSVKDSFTATTLLNSTLAVCDEISFDKSKDGQDLANKLKILITEDKVAIRRMHRESEEASSWVNLIFFSNHTNKALYIEEGDRRFMVYNQKQSILDRYGKAFIDEYNDALASGELEAQAQGLLHHLLNLQVTVNLARPPQTEAKDKLVRTGVSSIVSFVEDIKENGIHKVLEAYEFGYQDIVHKHQGGLWISLTKFKEVYRSWCKLEGRKANAVADLAAVAIQRIPDVDTKTVRVGEPKTPTWVVGGKGFHGVFKLDEEVEELEA